MLNSVVAMATSPVAGASVAETRPPTEMIVELDHRLSQAILAHDVASAAELYDDDFLLTVAGGRFKRKADMLADIGNPAVKLSVCDTTGVTVRVRGRTAVLTGLLKQAGTVNDRPIDVRLHVTDTWVNVDGKWLLLAGHASFAK
jgi:ketosteroid isomerase-like protein